MMPADPQSLRDGLSAALAVPRWVDDVAAAAPFGSLDDLLAVARAVATPLTEQEIDQAVSHHPRIGEQAAGQGVSAAFSRSEQSAVTPAGDEDGALTARIAQGNAEYEGRFGRVFIIRAAGRSRAEIAANLAERLELTPEAELENVAEQLRQIALLRLESLWGGA